MEWISTEWCASVLWECQSCTLITLLRWLHYCTGEEPPGRHPVLGNYSITGWSQIRSPYVTQTHSNWKHMANCKHRTGYGWFCPSIKYHITQYKKIKVLAIVSETSDLFLEWKLKYVCPLLSYLIFRSFLPRKIMYWEPQPTPQTTAEEKKPDFPC